MEIPAGKFIRCLGHWQRQKTKSDTSSLHRRRSLRYLSQFHRPAERNWQHHYIRGWFYNTWWVWNDENVANRPLHTPKEYVIRNFQISTGPKKPRWRFRRLSRKATTCAFENTGREILAQILQGCLSSKMIRKALRENSSLKQVLDQAIAIELVHVRATEMEQKEILALSSYNRNENDKRRTHRNSNCSSSKGTTNSSNSHSRY